jgi:hypothetical protein
MKFCKDCKYYFEDHVFNPKCNRPIDKINLVTGKSYYVSRSAYIERSISGECGEEAKFFVEDTKNKSLLKKILKFFRRK